jgi:hypothetical protein
MDWLSSDREDAFEYTRVNKAGEDVEILDIIQDGGQIDYNDLSSLKVSGSLPLIGKLDIGNDYVRVYSISELDGETVRIAHGTFIPSVPSFTLTDKRSFDGPLVTGTVKLYSLLQILEEYAVDKPYSVPAGTNAVGRAVTLVGSMGLRVVSDNSTSLLKGTMSFDAGISYLEIINDLLKYAGFDTAEIDGYGNVIFKTYQDPALLEPVVTFSDDDRSIFNPEVPYEFDMAEVPNKVIAVVENQDTVMTAVAINADPMSRYSTVRREKVVTYTENASQIETQAELNALAQRVLQEKTSAVESVEIEHSYIPYDMGQAALLDYQRAETSFVGVAASKTLALSRGMTCRTRFRRFVRF